MNNDEWRPGRLNPNLEGRKYLAVSQETHSRIKDAAQANNDTIADFCSVLISTYDRLQKTKENSECL